MSSSWKCARCGRKWGWITVWDDVKRALLKACQEEKCEPLKVPNPGSDAAVKAGCLCPVLDNHLGAGFRWGESEQPQFWIQGDCPLHAALFQ